MREVKKNTEEMSRKKSHYLYMRSVNRVNASAMNYPPSFYFHLVIFVGGFYLVYFHPLERISCESYPLLSSAFSY
jgi:hypothetical protein